MSPRTVCAVMLAFLLLVSAQAVQYCPAGIHPIIEARYGHLFGGCIDGKWMVKESMAQKMTGREQYRLYSPTRYLGTVVGGKVSLDHEEDGDPLVELGPLPKEDKADDAALIGICGTWNALPRQFKVEDVKRYEPAVRSYLKQQGLATSPMFISRVWRIDLEGDGYDEVLIAASSMKDEYSWPEKLAGYYSVVLLQKTVKGTTQTITVAKSAYRKNHDDHHFYTMESLLDVNGDGIMEVILGWNYNGVGNGHNIYQIGQNKATEVLSEGWVD